MGGVEESAIAGDGAGEHGSYETELRDTAVKFGDGVRGGVHGEFAHGFIAGGVGLDGFFEAVVDVLGEFDGAGGICGSEVRGVDGTGKAEDLEGDAAFVHVFEALGATLVEAAMWVGVADVGH